MNSHHATVTVAVTNLDGVEGETDDVVYIIESALASAGYKAAARVYSYGAYGAGLEE